MVGYFPDIPSFRCESGFGVMGLAVISGAPGAVIVAKELLCSFEEMSRDGHSLFALVAKGEEGPLVVHAQSTASSTPSVASFWKDRAENCRSDVVRRVAGLIMKAAPRGVAAADDREA